MAVQTDLLSLVERVRTGDRSAFAELYDHLAARVFGIVKRVLRDPAMSEEVTQEVFVELWRDVERYDASRASVQAWASTIARRRAIDRVRKEQTLRDHLERRAGDVRHDPPSPDDEVVATIEAGRVRDALATLPDEQQEALRLTFLEGHPHTTVAEMLSLPLGTVKGRVRIGLRKLREELGDDR